MKLSIVSTLYRSAPYIEEFCRRASAAAEARFGEDYEIVLVDDGSPDNSLAVALECCRTNPHLRVAELSRNFGHHKAMMTACREARGELVFLIDVDLEESPEWLADFHQQLEESGCDVVFGVQQSRKGSWFERLTGQLFYRFFNFCAGVKLPENLVTARLMKRAYVDELLKFEEREVMIAGLWVLTGFRQQPRTVVKSSRGTTSYSLQRKLNLVVQSVTSFSVMPLYLIFYSGLLITLLAAAYVTYLLIFWSLNRIRLDGWMSLIASLWLLGGITICFMGVIGLYIAKVFMEVKARPYTIIRQRYPENRESNHREIDK